jgi:hypothetical protein
VPEGARPITFAFNGGPGSSSLWLHVGVLGAAAQFIMGELKAPEPRFALATKADTQHRAVH